MIRIMIADDCITRVSKYSKFLTETKDIEIVSKTVDKETTLQNYLKLRPDILIISFNMSKDTFELIDSLSIDTEERKKCNIIIIGKKLKVDENSIINLSKVYCILTEIDYNDILYTINKMSSHKELSYQKIKTLLLSFRIDIYSRGASYIIEAINFAYNDPNLLYNISNLYEKIGAKYNISPNKIQRSIRGTIETMNNHISPEVLKSFFHIYEKKLVSPKYFLTMVLEHLLIEN